MDMGKTPSGSPDPARITFKMRDANDALYPCSVVDNDATVFPCYQLQGGLILERTHNDFAKATTECDKAPLLGRSQCYVSLGTNASGITVQDTKKAPADRACTATPDTSRSALHRCGEELHRRTQKPEDGFTFCKVSHSG